MKLYYSDASPYARTVRVFIREVNIEQKVTEVATHPFDNDEAFIKGNPLGKVPCLVLSQSESLYDSEIIVQYLDEKFNSGAMSRALAPNWEWRKNYSLIAGLLDLAVALRQEKMRKEENLASDFWWGRFVAGLDRGLQELDGQVSRFPSELSFLSINTACLLSYLDFRHAELPWCQLSNLSALYNDLSQRASMISTAPVA